MQILNQTSNLIEFVSDEFKGQYFYGLELILDELYDDKEQHASDNSESTIDWFGLSDLTI